MRKRNLKFLGVSLIVITIFLFKAIKVWAEGSLIPLSSVAYAGAGNDRAWAVAVDGEGNIIVTGSSNDDYFTIKYDRNFNQLCSAAYDRGNSDCAYGVAVDDGGNIFVTGTSSSTVSGNDYFTIKYDSDLVVLSSVTYDGGGNDYASGIVVDGVGNIIVTGYSNNGTDDDYFTIKYNQDLVVLSSVAYVSIGNDSAQAVAVDSMGNIIVTGCSDSNYFTIKYDQDLNEVCSTVYNGSTFDFAQGIAVDSNNNIIVTGFSYNGTTGFDYCTIKYDQNLGQLCSTSYNGSSNNYDYAYGVDVDEQGNIIVSGASRKELNDTDYFTIKYDQNLVVVSSAAYGGTNRDGSYGVAIDGQGNIIVTGYSYNAMTNNDYFTIKYNGSPMISSVSPTDGNHGETLVFTINGLNFFSGAKVDFSGEGIIVNSVNFINSTQIEVNITIVRGAFLGARDITVTNTDDVSATLSAAFEVRGLLSGDDDEIDEVKIQGGENGYVSFSKGDDVTIYFKTSDPGEIKLKVYTLRGQLAWEETKETDGEEDFIIWDGKNTEGTVVASGVYVILIDGPGINTTNKIAIIK